jgi:hypothetical protein
VSANSNELASRKLNNLRDDMSQAYEAGEWQRLAALDKTCQLMVRQVILENPRAMFDELRSLLGFYKSLLAKCECRRQIFASDAVNMRRGVKHNQTYNRLQRLVSAV